MRNMMIFGVVVLVFSGLAVADGKFYYIPDREVPNIPYQRAFILYLDGEETLFLQSKYDLKQAEEGKSLGWVVPVPSVPEVASVPADIMDYQFGHFARWAAPYVTYKESISFWIDTKLRFYISVLIGIIFILWLISLTDISSWLRRREEGCLYDISIFVILLILLAIAMPNQLRGRTEVGVEIINERSVGIYDVKTIKSDSANELIGWLKEGGFAFGEEDVEVFNTYISNGWCFVVANIKPDADPEHWKVVSNGLAAPLILRFEHETPVYPLMLTGTGGYNTDVLLYVASDTYMKCDDERLTLKFAGASENWGIDKYLWVFVEPKKFFNERKVKFNHLMKYKGALTPEEMRTDMTFSPSEEDMSYREQVTAWLE